MRTRLSHSRRHWLQSAAGTMIDDANDSRLLVLLEGHGQSIRAIIFIRRRRRRHLGLTTGIQYHNHTLQLILAVCRGRPEGETFKGMQGSPLQQMAPEHLRENGLDPLTC